MFPNGNIESEKSRFSENVPAWVLLAGGHGLLLSVAHGADRRVNGFGGRSRNSFARENANPGRGCCTVTYCSSEDPMIVFLGPV
jgi:hypothetical protein